MPKGQKSEAGGLPGKKSLYLMIFLLFFLLTLVFIAAGLIWFEFYTDIAIIMFLGTGIVMIMFLTWLIFILRKTDKELLKRYGIFKAESESLTETKSSLEVRIRARTRELQETMSRLEKENEERNKELKEKVAELERFNRLAVGRELKMIELKEEIKKLKSRAKK
jgi:hypothetical protein